MNGRAATRFLGGSLRHDAGRAARGHLRRVLDHLGHVLADPGRGRVRRVDGCVLRLEDADRGEDTVPGVDDPVALEAGLVSEHRPELFDGSPGTSAVSWTPSYLRMTVCIAFLLGKRTDTATLLLGRRRVNS